jgi:hypothetical protein
MPPVVHQHATMRHKYDSPLSPYSSYRYIPDEMTSGTSLPPPQGTMTQSHTDTGTDTGTEAHHNGDAHVMGADRHDSVGEQREQPAAPLVSHESGAVVEGDAVAYDATQTEEVTSNKGVGTSESAGTSTSGVE